MPNLEESTAGSVDAVASLDAVEPLLLIPASEQLQSFLLVFGARVEVMQTQFLPAEIEQEAIEYSVCTEEDYAGPVVVVYSAAVSVVAQLWIA